MPRILIVGLPPDMATWLEHRLGGVPVDLVDDGNAARARLETDTWSLVVLDDRLAKPPALELLEWLRAQPGLDTLPVVYCLSPTADHLLPRRLVDVLGVGQLLFQPLDREELARQVAAMLGQPLPPEAAAPPPRDTAAAVARVWAKFRPTILARVAVVEQATLALLQGRLDDALAGEAEAEAHKLAGSLGTFGFPRGTRLARQLEERFHGRLALSADDGQQLSEWVRALSAELDRAPASAVTTPLPGAPVDPDGDEPPLVLIVDDDAALAELLTIEAAAWGMRTLVAPDIAAARAALAASTPAVVLLDLLFAQDTRGALGLLAELTARTPPVPVLVLTGRDALAHRVTVAKLGGRGFLQKPVAPAQVLEAVTQLIQRERAAEAKVLVVDDDPQVLATVRMLLAPYHIRLLTLDDPLQFWDTLEEAAPDLVVLDVEMPYVSGIELCRVVRNDPRWAGLPVLFLTAHTDREVVHRVFAAGADDYVSKPIVGPELVTRINNRLERTQLLRSVAETDALTGVANRRKSGQVLGQFLRLAERYGQPLSLAVLDLDHFKQVNDHHGHAAGDAVLSRLGQLLQRSFRGEDVVARWGGEEFLVGMYGMTRTDGVQRLAEVLDALREEEFSLPDGTTFGVTFSAGVAEHPHDGADVQALYRAADAALYRAKLAGRNQVMATSSTAAASAQGRAVRRPG